MFLCSHSIIYSSVSVRGKRFYFSSRKFSRKKRPKKERNTKRPKNVHVSLVFFIRVVHPKYLAPLKILFLFPTDVTFRVALFDCTNAKRASKNDSSARLTTPAPTKRRTREREKHAHTHTQRRTWANASRKRRLRKKSSLNWTRRLRARSAITRNRSPRNSIFNSIRGWWSARCAGKNTRARSTIYRRPSTCIRIGSTRARG